MSDGILFYSNNEKPIPQFVLALHSLRKYYSGNVHIVFGPNTPKFFIEILKKNDVCSYSYTKRYWNKSNKANSRREWLEKPFVIANESPFDSTVFYDCDHIFYDKFDCNIFRAVEIDGLVISIKKSYAKRHNKILKQINDVTHLNLTEIERSNGGCVGYLKNCKIMDKVIERMSLYAKHGGKIIRFNSEEFAYATVVKEGYGSRVSEKWSYGYPSKGIMTEVPKGVIAVHFCVDRYTKGGIWNFSLKDAYYNNFLELRDKIDLYKNCLPFLNDNVDKIIKK